MLYRALNSPPRALAGGVKAKAVNGGMVPNGAVPFFFSPVGIVLAALSKTHTN